MAEPPTKRAKRTDSAAMWEQNDSSRSKNRINATSERRDDDREDKRRPNGHHDEIERPRSGQGHRERERGEKRKDRSRSPEEYERRRRRGEREEPPRASDRDRRDRARSRSRKGDRERERERERQRPRKGKRHKISTSSKAASSLHIAQMRIHEGTTTIDHAHGLPVGTTQLGGHEAGHRLEATATDTEHALAARQIPNTRIQTLEITDTMTALPKSLIPPNPDRLRQQWEHPPQTPKQTGPRLLSTAPLRKLKRWT